MYVWDSNRYAQTVNALISLECGPGTSEAEGGWCWAYTLSLGCSSPNPLPGRPGCPLLAVRISGGSLSLPLVLR